jgi:hypothetical protein
VLGDNLLWRHASNGNAIALAFPCRRPAADDRQQAREQCKNGRICINTTTDSTRLPTQSQCKNTAQQPSLEIYHQALATHTEHNTTQTPTTTIDHNDQNNTTIPQRGRLQRVRAEGDQNDDDDNTDYDNTENDNNDDDDDRKRQTTQATRKTTT